MWYECPSGEWSVVPLDFLVKMLSAQERKLERVLVSIQNIGMVVFLVLNKEPIQLIVTRQSTR